MLGTTQLRTPGALHEGTVPALEASSAQQVLAGFELARARGSSVTLLGARRSFGGQAFPVPGGFALDVGALDRGATVVAEQPDGSLWVRVGGGTRFVDLHAAFPNHRALGTPTTDTITVAGALAACCHGMTGYFADGVRALTLLTPAGERVACREGAEGRAGELFLASMGSLGALGVLTDIELHLWPVPGQLVVAESLHAGPAASGAYLAALEAATDDPRYSSAGAVIYGAEDHAIVVGERPLAPGERRPGARAPLTDDAHTRNAFTQGIANRFPAVARRVISRTYRQGNRRWSDWYGFAFFQRSYDRTDEVLRRRGPLYALARALGVDPRLPVLHQTWFFPRCKLRELMQLYWTVLRRYPGIEARAEQQDLILLPPCRWPLHSFGVSDEGVGVLTSSFAVRPGSELAGRVAAFLREFSAAAHAQLGDCRVSLIKQLHCEQETLRAMHASWIAEIRRWRAVCDPDGLLASRTLAQLGVT
jgi:FAD/FMN-containing dehydrogenase